MLDTPIRRVRRTRKNPDVRILTKRELAALYLVEEYLHSEIARVNSLRIALHHDRRWLLVKGPTSGYLWANTDKSAINDFFEKYGWFERKFMHPNQVARIVRDLREWGVFYNPNDPADAEAGASEELIPKSAGDRLYVELKELYGDNPTNWPDTVPYNIRTNRPYWNRAKLLPAPAYASAE